MMKSHHILSRLWNLKLTMLIAFFILCAISIVSSTVQSTQKEERELEDKIPKHLPIKVKVKNMGKVKDLNNDQWMRDVEIEVQNTGDKPIYYLRLSLYFMDVKLESGNELGFPMGYGNPQFVDFDKRASPQDVPLRPGETYIYQFSKRWAGRWEKFKATHKLPHPKKIGLQFEILSYGDGTGFVGTGGVMMPNPQSSNSTCDTQRKNGAVLKGTQETLPDRPPATQFQFVSFLPANFLPVNFSMADLSEPSPGTPSIQSGICCPSTSCSYLKLTLGGNCFCEDELGDPPLEANSAACGTRGGSCGTQGVQQFICSDNEHTCTTYFINSCIAPTPTPTPTPTPCAGEGRNGFLALALYDGAGGGGNGNGMIDAGDAIYPVLRLWQDTNHNGVSEAAELHPLPRLGVSTFDLKYKESKRTDEHGNKFMYRARVGDAQGAKVNRRAWDVFLVKAR